MSNDLYSIGASALTAAYTALRTSSNNVANANTPGYSRQTAVVAAQTGAFIGGFHVGQGVQVVEIKREYNDFLTQAAHLAQSQSSQADARHLRLNQVSNLFSDTENGIGNTIDQFFSAVQSLTQNPGDASTRQSMLAAARMMTARFDDVGGQLQDMRNSIDAELHQEIEYANLLSTQIADLNDRIALARGTGRAPNDLLDARDRAVRELNAAVRVSSVPQNDGTVNLFLANGQPLVVGNRAGTFAMQVSTIDPQEVAVGVRDAVGNLIELDPDAVGGGKVAGLLQFRAQDLPAVENRIGQLAVTLAAQFNQQHRLGNDRTGAAGGDFFTPPSIKAFAAPRNASAATVSANFVDTTAVQASDYQLEYLGAGSGWRLTRLGDGTVSSPAALPVTLDGMTIDVAGAPAAGDIFMIQPTRGGSRNLDLVVVTTDAIAAAAPVAATQPTSNTGSLSISDLSVRGPTRDPNLALPVTLAFSVAGGATTYSYTDAGGATVTAPYVAGTPITINGWSLTLQGAPGDGDTVAVAPNAGAVGDNRNAQKLAQLPSLALVSGGRLGGAYGAVVSTVGGLASSAKIVSDAQSSVLDDALAAESGVAGVNLDEEAARLMQLQQQYQAAAKVIATARSLFDEVLALGR